MKRKLIKTMALVTAMTSTSCAKKSNSAKYDYARFIGEWRYDLPNTAHGVTLSIDEVRNNNEMDITLFGRYSYNNLPIINNQVKSNDMVNFNLRFNSDTYKE